MKRSLRVAVPVAGALFLVLALVTPSWSAVKAKITSFSPKAAAPGVSVTLTGSAFTGTKAVKFNGSPAAFKVVSSTKVTATVPASATTGPITVTTGAGTSSSTTKFTVLPSVTGFTPASGTIGSGVTINGTGLVGATAVSFNGVSAAFVVNSATSISATVPPLATSGKVKVTTPAGTVTSKTVFSVLPKITSVAPAGGTVGAAIDIYGSAFNGVSAVKINGVAVTSFAVLDSTHIQATVPLTTSGPVQVTTTSGTAVSATPFAVQPKITQVSPGSGAVGAIVTITGTAFTGATAVTFNGSGASFTINSATQITATVPAAATTGLVDVTTPAGTAVSPGSFSVLPTITNFAPTSGTVGSSVVITGTTFVGVTQVTIGGNTASFTVDSPTQITAVVPPTVSGPISVTTAGGTATTSGSFTVLPSVTLGTSSGPPTGSVTVNGFGFSPNTVVDVYFDSTSVALVGTDATGSFTGLSVTVPGAALPGSHTVSAVQRSNGKFAQKPFTVGTDWAMFRFGAAHRGYNPYENVIGTSNVGNLTQQWATSVNGAPTSAAVVGSTLYVGSADFKLYAIDTSTGSVKWTFQTTGTISSSPAVVNGVAYVGSADGKLYAIDTSTGLQAWSATIGAAVNSAPTVSGNTVLVGSSNGNVYAFDAATGAAPLWSANIGGSVTTSPAVANGLAVFTSSNGKVSAYSVSNGSLAWSVTPGGTPGSPAIAAGTVFVGSSNGTVYALALGSGNGVWNNFMGTSFGSSAPAVANGIVYFGANDGNVYAFDMTGGNPWANGNGSAYRSPVSVANSVVYAGSDDNSVYAFDTNGNIVWRGVTAGAVRQSPVMVNGWLFVPSNDNKVYAYATG